MPEPLVIEAPLVKYEFIGRPNSAGFDDDTESGQVIPVSFQRHHSGYTQCMFLNGEGPIAGGRELWGFPKKLAEPRPTAEGDALIGTRDYGPVCIATGAASSIGKEIAATFAREGGENHHRRSQQGRRRYDGAGDGRAGAR